ncbi:hypothetical protein ALQ37_200195 [Pseudomonas syringae pv. aptata]|uniref:Uncharacterized protein n=1 Tax=Pseudomonas syringae pv. aptata TaxID=83167 RepID=A0A3M3X5Z9_PSEAP|nr:hypothetical protein [Pseudomonas syringae]RMO65371.1 hypothetical protein ALQ37_200195 [Pseudomonas syringae pv. aptata]
MNKYDVSRKESLWFYVILLGVLALGNYSVRYPIVGVIEFALLFVLMGYSIFRNLQIFKASRGHDESTVERFQQLMGDPKVVETLEASMSQSKIAEANKSEDEPRLIRALREVRKHHK